MTDDIGRGDNSSKLVKLVRRLSADENARGGVDEILLAVRLIKATLKSHGADIHDLADMIQKYEEGKLLEVNGKLVEVREEFYRQAYLKGLNNGAEAERKKMAQSGAVGFSIADSEEVSWQQAVLYAEQRSNRLNEWERGFIEGLVIQMKHDPSKPASDKQKVIIFKMYRRLGGKL